MDQGYNEEAARLAAKAVKRLNVCKLAVEYFYHRDQYDSDELNFAISTEKGWQNLTVFQREIVYMHLIQGFSFSGIADLQGISPQAVSQAFQRACKHFQAV